MIDQPNTILVSVDKSYLVLQALAFYFFYSVLQALAFLFFYLKRRNNQFEVDEEEVSALLSTSFVSLLSLALGF